MSRRAVALAGLLGVAASGGALAAPDAAADAALHESARDDGTRLTRASLCGYEEPALERLNARTHAAADARYRAAGRAFDQEAYDAGFQSGMERAMSQLLQLPAEQVEDRRRYRASHCAQVRAEVDALLAEPAAP